MKYAFLEELQSNFPKESSAVCDHIRKRILENELTTRLTDAAVAAGLKCWTPQKEDEICDKSLYKELKANFMESLTEQKCQRRILLVLCETVHQKLLDEKSVHEIRFQHLYIIWTENVKPAFSCIEPNKHIALCNSRLVLHVWLMLLFKEHMKHTAKMIASGQFLSEQGMSIAKTTWRLTEMLSLGIALDSLDSGIMLVKNHFDQHHNHCHSSSTTAQESSADADIIARIREYVDIHQFVEIFSPTKSAKERNRVILLKDMSTYIAQDERSTRAFLSTLRTLMFKIRTFREIRRIYWTSAFGQLQARLIQALRRLLGAGVRTHGDVVLDPDTTLQEIFSTTEEIFQKEVTPVESKKSIDRIVSEICGKELVLSARWAATRHATKCSIQKNNCLDENNTPDQSASDLIDIFISFFGTRSAFFGKFAESLAIHVIKQVREPLPSPSGTTLSSSLASSSFPQNYSLWSPTSRMNSKKITWMHPCEYDNNLHNSVLLFNIIQKRITGSSWNITQPQLASLDCHDTFGETGWKTRFLACKQLLTDLKRTTRWQQDLCPSKCPTKAEDVVFVMSKYAWPSRVEIGDDMNPQGTAATLLSNIWTADTHSVIMGQDHDPIDAIINSWFISQSTQPVTPVVKAFAELLSQYESAHANQTLVFHGNTSFVKLIVEDDNGLRTVSLDIISAQIVCILNEMSPKSLSAKDMANTLGLPISCVSPRIESLMLQQFVYQLPDNTLSLKKSDCFRPTENPKQTQTILLQDSEYGGGSDENTGRLNSVTTESATSPDNMETVCSAIVTVLREAESAHQGIPWGMAPYTIFPEIKARLKYSVAWRDFARALFSLTQNKTLVNRGGNYFFNGGVHSNDTATEK